MVLAKGFVHQQQLAAAVERIRPSLGQDVVRLTYVLGEDGTEDPAIFFRVVLTDRASARNQLLAVIKPIEETIVDGLMPQEEWGLMPYFTYRSETENSARADKNWH